MINYIYHKSQPLSYVKRKRIFGGRDRGEFNGGPAYLTPKIKKKYGPRPPPRALITLITQTK
ncbi:hypothetical protein, partial [Bariatricus sp. HCP28S3_H2]|uniref:hypothetical protein n=1 Tax=Bariatricus sp. HCP28S3_H2 TaxID=3438905 RepID=UPI003F8AE64D